MLDKYVYGANAICLVYDVTNYNSFENLEEWLKQCKAILASTPQGAASNPSPNFALIANKIDLEHLRTVKSDRHHRFAQENGLLTYALSAKSGEGVNLCFQKIAAELLGIKCGLNLGPRPVSQFGKIVFLKLFLQVDQNGDGATATSGEGRDRHIPTGSRPSSNEWNSQERTLLSPIIRTFFMRNTPSRFSNRKHRY